MVELSGIERLASSLRIQGPIWTEKYRTIQSNIKPFSFRNMPSKLIS